MRILSQDGLRFDIEYENCHLAVNEKCCEIEAETNNPNFTPVMASYSSIEKCRKAMEMLQKAYSPLLVMKEQPDGIMPNIKPNDWIVGSVPTPKVEVMDNFYFQFPTDDEVEV